jgi:hypothetical protein
MMTLMSMTARNSQRLELAASVLGFNSPRDLLALTPTVGFGRRPQGPAFLRARRRAKDQTPEGRLHAADSPPA